MAQRSLHLLFLSTAVAALAACGGGGGGGGDSEPPAPTPAPGSGLAPADAFISQSAGTARNLASRVAYVFNHAPQGAAAVALGGAAPVPGEDSVQCDGGNGEVDYADGPGDSLIATFDQCVIGDYTFNGTATVTYTEDGGDLDSYTIAFENGAMNVRLPNSGASQPLSAGSVQCDMTSGGQSLCVAEYQLVNWGNDFVYDYDNAVANGSTGCLCGEEKRVNVHATNLAATTGQAEVTGRDDSGASITRSGAQAFEVELTSGDSTVVYPFTDIVPES